MELTTDAPPPAVAGYHPSSYLLDPRNWPEVVRAAHAGTEPAEALDSRWRTLLWFVLVEQGLTDLEIAELTRTSLYTTVRLRRRLGLEANEPPTPLSEAPSPPYDAELVALYETQAWAAMPA
jgi:hypothetical protein